MVVLVVVVVAAAVVVVEHLASKHEALASTPQISESLEIVFKILWVNNLGKAWLSDSSALLHMALNGVAQYLGSSLDGVEKPIQLFTYLVFAGMADKLNTAGPFPLHMVSGSLHIISLAKGPGILHCKFS